MIFRFSKEQFMKNAPKNIRRILSPHINVLNGMEVKFNEEFGEIEEYIVDGEKFSLYPIYEDWCKLSTQMSLF